MSAPLTEERLAEIEARADDYVTRCRVCDCVARVVTPGTSRALCAACAPDVPGSMLPLVSSYADALDLAAEVRRLRTALAAARREGAEAMRERAANACERMVVGGCAWSEEQATAARALLDAAGNVRALPLDAPGGES